MSNKKAFRPGEDGRLTDGEIEGKHNNTVIIVARGRRFCKEEK